MQKLEILPRILLVDGKQFGISDLKRLYPNVPETDCSFNPCKMVFFLTKRNF